MMIVIMVIFTVTLAVMGAIIGMPIITAKASAVIGT